MVPAISAPRAERQLAVAKRTARLSIDKLVEHGILHEATGRQQNRIFLAQENIDIVDAPEDESLENELLGYFSDKTPEVGLPQTD